MDDQMTLFRPEGRTIDHARDDRRLSAQMAAVIEVMRDGQWRDLLNLSRASGAPEASCSARLRDVNKPQNRWMGYEMEASHVARGYWIYRLLPRLHE